MTTTSCRKDGKSSPNWISDIVDDDVKVGPPKIAHDSFPAQVRIVSDIYVPWREWLSDVHDMGAENKVLGPDAPTGAGCGSRLGQPTLRHSRLAPEAADEPHKGILKTSYRGTWAHFDLILAHYLFPFTSLETCFHLAS